MQTHGHAVTSIALWFTMLSPAFGLIIAFLSAWLFGRLNIQKTLCNTSQSKEVAVNESRDPLREISL